MFIPDATVLVAAHKFTGAQEIMSRIRYAYELCANHIRCGVKSYNKQSIEFDNGSRIIAQTTTETTGRGLSLSLLYADEFAFVEPNIAVEFWTSISPTLATGGKAIITSTPNSDEDQFANIYIPSQTAVGNEENNIFSNSVSGGSIFTVKDFIVPNPRIAFYGEEIMIAARAFTNGFDLLLPRKQYMYHLYFNHSKPKESLRRLLWNDFPDHFAQIDTISKAEIVDIFSNNLIGKEQLGKERSLDEFGSLIGLDFKNKTVISNKCI
jgi:hypothetical protein